MYINISTNYIRKYIMTISSIAVIKHSNTTVSAFDELLVAVIQPGM